MEPRWQQADETWDPIVLGIDDAPPRPHPRPVEDHDPRPPKGGEDSDPLPPPQEPDEGRL
jgi:hypothetical protein